MMCVNAYFHGYNVPLTSFSVSAPKTRQASPTKWCAQLDAFRAHTINEKTGLRRVYRSTSGRRCPLSVTRQCTSATTTPQHPPLAALLSELLARCEDGRCCTSGMESCPGPHSSSQPSSWRGTVSRSP